MLQVEAHSALLKSCNVSLFNQLIFSSWQETKIKRRFGKINWRFILAKRRFVRLKRRFGKIKRRFARTIRRFIFLKRRFIFAVLFCAKSGA